MSERPFVLLSCAVSMDGYIDDATEARLLLSNDADFDRVDEVRAGVDAIMVGAETIRRDNPRLLVRSAARRQDRVAHGLPESPIKVTVTASGNLDPDASFFTSGDVAKIVYCPDVVAEKLTQRLGAAAQVVPTGPALDLEAILTDLSGRGVGRLMVEGGTSMHTQFLAAGRADELHLVVAPFLVGDSRAPRFAGDAAYPYTSAHRMRLLDVTPIGDCVLLRYAP